MTEAVVVEYNAETGEAIVETIDAISRRYFVPISLSSLAGSFRTEEMEIENVAGSLQQDNNSGKRYKTGYGDNIFNLIPLGRCVTIEPVDEITMVFNNVERVSSLSFARLKHVHETGFLTSKTILPGTITRVLGRFVFIFCSFIPYEAVATREMFLTSSSSLDVSLEQTATSENEVLSFLGKQEEWVGRLVNFVLHPMSFLVMEVYFASMEVSRGRDETLSTGHTCGNYREESRSGRFFRFLFDKPRRSERGAMLLMHKELLNKWNKDQLGSWHVTGTDPCVFFHPKLSVQFKLDSMLLPCNAIPPTLHQKSAFTIQLWCFWMLSGTEVSLHVLDGAHCDVTSHILHSKKVEAAEYPVVMLDNPQTIAAVTFENNINCFRMNDAVYEIKFMLLIKRGSYETRLESRPVFLRRRYQRCAVNIAIKAGKPTQMQDALSRKFWALDVLGPEDKITMGFTDPGRSNDLVEVDYCNGWPTVEREVIVVDPEDARLQTIAAVARRAVLGIVDTIVCVEALTWLVASACGGESGVINAESEIILLRQRKLLRKRRRDANQDNDVTNVIRLGDIRNGVCRHRALLFKYLCDVVQLPCYLIRGEHQGPGDSVAERHSWNIVPLGDSRHLLVDATLNPHKVEMWPVSAYIGPSFELNEKWSSTCHCMALPTSAAKISLMEECGRGATAVVRRGLLGGGLTCVVKMPRKGEDVDTLIYEYGVLKKFSFSLHVVRCLGWSCGGIVLEYFPTNLLAFMNRLILCGRRMGISQQKKVLLGVLSALKEMHSRGYVHRDIKAENILLIVICCTVCHSVGTVCNLCDVQVKLGDFADSVEVNANTLMHEPAPPGGTPPYTAPELEFEMPFSFAADIWSCGILAIEMALMRLPKINVWRKGRKKTPCNEINDNCNCNSYAIESDDDEMRDIVPVMTNDGHILGHVSIPRLPHNILLLKWQREFVEGALHVDWRQRASAAALLDILNTFIP